MFFFIVVTITSGWARVSNFIGAGPGLVIVVVSGNVGHVQWLRSDSRVAANRGEETCIKRKRSIY